MNIKKIYTERNIEKLIVSSLKKENQLNEQLKKDVLNLLLPKLAQQKKELQHKPRIVIGLSVIWIVIPLLVFSEFKNSTYILDFIKAALSLSLFLIPFSSIILIIIKMRSHEKKMV
jgi:hypothetical protein